jgi:hypothetical protein
MESKTQKTLLSDGIAQCCRCGAPCRKMPGKPSARLLRYSLDSVGFCVNCAATEFLQGLHIISYQRPGDKPFDPKYFRLPRVQSHFAAILLSGKADAKPEEIDWLEVAANWHLPFPKLRRKRKKNP